MTRTQRVESERELERAVDDFSTRGFKIKSQSKHSAKVKEEDWGDVPIHGFIFIFTLIVAAVLFDMAALPSGGVWLVAFSANVIYAAYSLFTADEVIIKVDSSQS